MNPRLTRIPFTTDDLGVVQDFACGSESWERYLADWIQGKSTGEKSVIQALQEDTSVWLYVNDQRAIVGYGSLGVTQWMYPDPFHGEKATIAIIPAFAVNAPFQHQPPGDWQQRFSTEILSDLIETAKERHRAGNPPDPVLGLFVDMRNERARTLYERVGFEDYGRPIKDKGTGVIHQRMVLKLD